MGKENFCNSLAVARKELLELQEQFRKISANLEAILVADCETCKAVCNADDLQKAMDNYCPNCLSRQTYNASFLVDSGITHTIDLIGKLIEIAGDCDE